MTGATITGWGKCRPPLSLTNADLERLVDTSDEWIRERTGIESRGMCHLETTDMAEVAARHGLGLHNVATIVGPRVTRVYLSEHPTPGLTTIQP